jgi:TonB-dependent Receptor Plug Domain
LFNRVLILFFYFLFVLNLNAQDNSKTTTLKSILNSIEKKHHVTFNFIESDITNFEVTPPKTNLTLLEKINYLHDKTDLNFENIDNKFINIFKNNTSKIYGFIYSSFDNLPIENALIKSNSTQKTASNRKGYFEINYDNSNEIIISCLGYRTRLIAVSDFKNKKYSTLLLEPVTISLNEIKTTNFLTTGISKTQENSIEIKPKKMGILPGLIEADVLQVMQQIPGINSSDESVASINVRGGTHDQNLFLWNDIKMYQTGHFFGLISAFNPNLAHTISIYKNGSSAFYGESVSSVVAISSDTKTKEQNNFSAGFNLINADIYAKYNVNKNDFLEFAARKSLTELFKSPTYNQYFDKAFQNSTITDLGYQNLNFTNSTQFNFYDLTLKYDQKIGLKNEIIIDLININDKLEVLQESNINNKISTENNILYQKSKGGNVTLLRNWNKKNSTKLNFYSSLYELDAERNSIQINQIVKQENTVFDNGLKLQNNHFLNSKFSFNNGYQFSQVEATNSDEISSPKFIRKNTAVLRTHALILEGKFNDTVSKLHITTGFRINYIEKFKKFLVEPRFQLNYEFSQNLKLELLAEMKSQTSFQVIDFQKDYFGIEKRRWILSDDNLIPIQKSKQVSVNFSYSNKNWVFTIENYYKKVIGINTSSQGFQNQLEFVKLNGDYEILGSEFFIQKKINNFVTWLSYTYNDNNYNFPDLKNPIFSNNFELNHVFSWAGIYERKNLKIALGSKWYSGKPETTPILDTINFSNITNPIIDYNIPNNKLLDSFFQVNFSTTYKWKSYSGTQFKLGISVLNILNRENEINEFYRINTNSNAIEDVKTYALKRTPNLSFRVSF